MNKQTGLTVIEVIVVIAIVLVVGFGIYGRGTPKLTHYCEGGVAYVGNSHGITPALTLDGKPKPCSDK